MTLKKCKVTRLDDTFWRVDWEGKQACFRVDGSPVEGWFWRSPMVVAEDPPGSWRPHGFDTICCRSLDSLLSSFGLTADEPRPETAEARVRAWTADASAGRETDWLAPADLRAILAELDRLREELEAAGARWHMLSKERDMLAEKLSEQRQVDVDAVLAPVREALCLISDHRASVKRSLDTAYKNGYGAQGSDYRLLGYAYDLAAVHVTDALAAAEKIGRGE